MVGNFGEVSSHTHNLIAALATSRVRKAGVNMGRRGWLRTEEAEHHWGKEEVCCNGSPLSSFQSAGKARVFGSWRSSSSGKEVASS